ncbi:MAG: hypothetical protein HC857_01825 [Synechococcales cyanobacterium RU_4_20]|nr:hypothetical protein [Synechococcales cyanobacterium RU_4_20]NJR68713.1 hypothetical protein [Synechococcales cyanobacterium CRU_2_2]
MTPKLKFSEVSLQELKAVVELHERDALASDWVEAVDVVLSDGDRQQLEHLRSRLVNEKLHLLNEATLWARAIYPLLILAERDTIRAWSEVPLQARYAKFDTEGIADGVLGRSVAGRLEAPYLIVAETKRGIENQNPLFQLYTQLLAAARLNWELDNLEPQEVFGCYTIADSWTFVRAEVKGLESDRPTLTVEGSKEYTEKNDAEIILQILKGIVSRREHNPSHESINRSRNR